MNLFETYTTAHADTDVIIADECQFFTEKQIDELRRIVDECDIPVLCFGLRTDFLCHLFTGSRRLFETADSISEIKTICSCGSKATVNARLDGNMNVVTEGAQVMIGGNETYIAMCHRCWHEAIERQKNEQGENI
jgi:thymidine kinase